MGDERRRIVPIEEAIQRIGKKHSVHTFMQGGFALLGADHDRAGLIDAMRLHGVEEAGEVACAMGHTLVIVKYPTLGDDVTPLFIEAKPRTEAPPASDAVDPHVSDPGKPTTRDKASSSLVATPRTRSRR
jgi:hypothetical protein